MQDLRCPENQQRAWAYEQTRMNCRKFRACICICFPLREHPQRTNESTRSERNRLKAYDDNAQTQHLENQARCTF